LDAIRRLQARIVEPVQALGDEVAVRR
ncbi:MAG: hypothetical protein JWN36_2525, partial [Microbacteriaceae bacterium]|nr:hypothetical protein [Microbacteriaceae bacterium]